MTNTESRIAIALEELAPGDDAQVLEGTDHQVTKTDNRELAVYGFDSEQRTLVGLGPVERARRSRRAAEIPDSDRAPQSESTGPFIAHDDEIPATLPKRKLGPWAVAAPALLLAALVAAGALRGLAPGAPHASAASQTAVVLAPRPTDVPPPPAAAASPAEPAPRPGDAATPPADVAAKVESASVANATAGSEPTRVTVPVMPAALPVNLPDLAPPPVVDMSNRTDANVGSLNVTSNPPANVVLDGRPLGKSPRVVKVPAGLHTVVFIHPLYGRQSLSVNVPAGATTGASADF